MFLFEALFLISVMYWMSAFISDIFFTAHEEYQLSPVIRVGFGFFISIAFFSGVWIVMSVNQAWLLGVLLLICNIKLFPSATRCKHFIGAYLKGFLGMLAVASLFFLPLIISNNYGPFTEGGGDITIYADTAQYALKNQLTALGASSKNISDIPKNMHNLFFPEEEMARRKSAAEQRLMNPPAAENAIYRVMNVYNMHSLLYVPCAMYSLFGGEVNYSTYFAVQAFLYFCIVGGFWFFFRRFGIKFGAFAALLMAGSYGVLSVFYNMYALQAAGLAISALILAALPIIRPFSWASFRTYGSVLLYIWLCYIHYFVVVLPVLFCSLFFERTKVKVQDSKNKSIFHVFSVIIFLSAWFLAACIAFAPSISLAQKLIEPILNLLFPSRIAEVGSFSHDFLGGDGFPLLSFQRLAFMFGFFSQQNILPYAAESQLINVIIKIGIGCGIYSLLVGAFVLILMLKSNVVSLWRKKGYFFVYAAAIFVVIAQGYFGQTSLYTQAKGAQNVLVYFYLIMLLPVALGSISRPKNMLIYSALISLKTTVCLFVLLLLTARFYYTAKLGLELDRGVILEHSYFAEADKIKAIDQNAFVLFEPRKSGDLYLSIQPFYGLRMVSTRHLVIQRSYENYINPDHILFEVVLIPDLIQPSDLHHLWTLNFVCKDDGLSDRTNKKCAWKAHRLIDLDRPRLMLFADNYEKNYGERQLNNAFSPTAMFSYMSNGAAMLYLPQGGGKVEVLIEPRSSDAYQAILKDVSIRKKKNQFDRCAVLTADGQYIRLTYDLPNNKLPKLLLLVRITSNEYWLSVRLDGKEIRA